jgi:hypothetical protein
MDQSMWVQSDGTYGQIETREPLCTLYREAIDGTQCPFNLIKTPVFDAVKKDARLLVWLPTS